MLYISYYSIMRVLHFTASSHSMYVVGVKFRSAMYMVGEGDGSVTVTVEASKEHADFDFVINMVAHDGTAESM